MARRMTELLELDEQGNVIGILASERPFDELVEEGRRTGRRFVSPPGDVPEDPAELELMRIDGGVLKQATAAHRKRVEGDRRAATRAKRAEVR